VEHLQRVEHLQLPAEHLRPPAPVTFTVKKAS
jgi:hypothetical protein